MVPIRATRPPIRCPIETPARAARHGTAKSCQEVSVLEEGRGRNGCRRARRQEWGRRNVFRSLPARGKCGKVAHISINRRELGYFRGTGRQTVLNSNGCFVLTMAKLQYRLLIVKKAQQSG